MAPVEPCFLRNEGGRDWYCMNISSDSDETPVVYTLMIVRFGNMAWKHLYMLKNHVWNRAYLKKKKAELMNRLGLSTQTESGKNWTGFGGEGGIDPLGAAPVPLPPSCVDGFAFYKDHLFVWGSNFKYKRVYNETDGYVRQLDGCVTALQTDKP